MASIERRWEYAWLLLSLDLMRPYWPDLWLSIPEPLEFQKGLRQRLSGELDDKIDYVTNYGAIHYRLADWFTTIFGQSRFDDLGFWVGGLLVAEGPRRLLADQWATLTQRLSDPKYEAPPWVIALCRRVTAEYRRDFKAFKTRVEITQEEPRSDWDTKVLNFTDRSVESILTTIRLTGWSNLFLHTWERYCAALTYEQLAEIQRNGQRIAEAPEIRLKRDSIVFPGLWRFELAPYVRKLAAAGVISI